MTITWLGQTCFKIEAKQAAVLVGHRSIPGGKLAQVAADIFILPGGPASGERPAVDPSSFLIESPGEFEVKGVFVEGRVLGERHVLVYRFEVEGIRFGHLDHLAKSDEAVAGFLEDVDVLFVPVGGGDVLTPAEAADVVSSIEPRLVIPMGYRELAAPNLQPVEKFTQAMGVKAPEHLRKLSLAKKDLPHEETRLIILEA